tara:strand:- start:430 stop:714 length:285 start_codon:yes stop_codon:yes gene_type:complete
LDNTGDKKMEIKITLTSAQEKALAYVAVSPQEWAENLVHNRCRIAIDEIYDMEVARMTADPDITSIPADKDAVVLAADIKSAAERNAEEEDISG